MTNIGTSMLRILVFPEMSSKRFKTEQTPPADSTVNDQFPSPFKKTLFWPSTPTTSTQKRKSKEKVPAVATSVEWRQYFSKKEKEKTDKIKKIEENKRKREEIAEKKKDAGKATKGKKKKCNTKESAPNDSESSWYCKICEDTCEQDMIQCLSCKCWVHDACANVPKSANTFFCSLCT